MKYLVGSNAIAQGIRASKHWYCIVHGEAGDAAASSSFFTVEKRVTALKSWCWPVEVGGEADVVRVVGRCRYSRGRLVAGGIRVLVLVARCMSQIAVVLFFVCRLTLC